MGYKKEKMNSNNLIKIVLLGDGRVGKTSIISKFFREKFDKKEEMTINSSYEEREYTYKDKNYIFCIWDTAGQEKFNALTPLYYRDANGALLVYDVTIKETFQKVEKWVEELKIFNKDIEITVAGNKSDVGKFDIDRNLLNEYCEDNMINSFFTSAKTGDGLKEMFDNIFHKLAKKYYSKGSSKKRGLTIVNNNEDKNNGCC